MKRAAFALLPLLLWACEPATLPAPSILSVEPQSVPADSAAVLAIKVSAVLPVSVNYGDHAVDPDQLAITLRLAGQVVDVPFADRDGTLLAPVPEGLALGDYDARLTLADGREAVREDAFSVVPVPLIIDEPDNDGGAPGDGGTDAGPPDNFQGDITGFEIDPIGDQVRDVPFRITIRAKGPGADTFREAVFLRASKEIPVARLTGPFSAGVRVEEITLSHPSPGIYILVEDIHGHKGLSKPFRVRPH
jgi:hypothetical protein